MVSWSNWSGKQKSKPEEIKFIRSEEDASAIAANTGASIRVVGTGHSHSLLVPHDGIIADVSGLAGVIDCDLETKRAWVWAGSKIYSLGRPLHEAGLALKNQGDIDQQAIAGACATGTHGTGKDLQNLSSGVMGARVALASGEMLDCSEGSNEDAWQVSRLSLGALGIVTRLQLQLRDACVLKESGFNASYDALVPDIDTLIEDNDRFEFFWYPKTDQATVKVINETTDDPEYPVAEEGSRVAWSYEVLPNHRPHFHTEMEYSVPASNGLNCFNEIRELLKTEFPDVAWPVEYRTVAEDDVWLSMAYGRPTITLSVHQDVREDESSYYRACEEIFLSHGGRPHWGKVNYLDGKKMADIHPCWEQWWAARNHYDPDGKFLNEYLGSLRS
jgi:FAD/FMN-containing dehydrogenase